MKIVYCINSTYNSGGMERILMYKVNYLADVLHYDVCIVTTDQKGLNNFFPFSSRIRFVDLDVNYEEDNTKNLCVRFFCKEKKKRKHRKLLTEMLNREKPDICISMFCMEMEFLYRIKDGSRKILEYHFSKGIKLIEAPNRFIYCLQKLRLKWWERIVQQYSSFVVLTEEDKKAWGAFDNMTVIPNFLVDLPKKCSTVLLKRVISVGRLEFQKGFDYLIQIWAKIHEFYPDWQLYIIGNGSQYDYLHKMIESFKLNDVVFLTPATATISKEYLQSSIYAMTSRYEGLPMVLLEAMSFGLPIVSFACPCGPKDIIDSDFGSLISVGDIDGFVEKLLLWMGDYDKRCSAGRQARKKVEQQYLQKNIMEKWDTLFHKVLAFK